MENKKQLRLIKYGLFALTLLLFGVYSSTMNYAHAVPTIANIPYGTGTLTNNGVVAFQDDSLTTKKAWIAGRETGSGIVSVWTKSTTLDTITGVTSLASVHTTVNAIEYVKDNGGLVVMTTNSGYAVLRGSDSVLLNNKTDGGFNNIVDLYYNDANNILYGAFSTGYKKITISGSTLTVSATVNYGANCNSTCNRLAIDEGDNFMYIIDNGGAPTDGVIRYNIASDTFVNRVTWASSPFDVQVDTDNNFVFISGSALGQVRKYVQDLSSFTTLTVTSTPRFMAQDSVNNILYVFADSDDTIRLFDTINNVQTDSLSTSCTNVYTLDAKRHTSESLGIMACDGANAKIVHNDRVSAIASQVCVDTNPIDDFVEITCFNDLDGDGIPDMQTSTGQRVLQNTTTLVHQIACQAGIADCNNPDSKTNGMGLFLLLMLLLMSVGVIMFVTYRTDHSLNDIHPVLWFILVMAVTGISWQLKWTDAIPFFASVIAICALGAFKAREWFGG